MQTEKMIHPRCFSDTPTNTPPFPCHKNSCKTIHPPSHATKTAVHCYACIAALLCPLFESPLISFSWMFIQLHVHSTIFSFLLLQGGAKVQGAGTHVHAHVHVHARTRTRTHTRLHPHLHARVGEPWANFVSRSAGGA
jgi:hypothetical protein